MNTSTGLSLRRRFHKARSDFRAVRRFLPGYFRVLQELHEKDSELIPAIARAISGDRQAQNEMIVRFASMRLSVSLDACHNAPKGFAKALLAESATITVPLSSVAHLGALQPLLAVHCTRLQYVMLTQAAVLELKQAHLGRGLGAKAPEMKSMTRMVLAQCWSILFNYGHLFGTFSTERMVLYEIVHSAALRRSFLQQVDSRLRSGVEGILDDQDLYRFHIALACWRVSRWPDDKLRTNSVHCLAAYFNTSSDDPTRWLHRTARRLAYNRLQSMADVHGEFVKTSHAHNVERTRPFRRLLGVSDHTADLFDALDRYHHDVVFSTPRAAGLGLGHIGAFRCWRQAHPEQSKPDWIDALFAEPADWPILQTDESLQHVARVSHGTTSGWTSTVDAWLGADAAIWDSANFVVTPSHEQDRMDVDLYGPAGRLSWAEATHVLNVLHRLEADSAADPVFDASVANYVACRLERCLTENYTVLMEPAQSDAAKRWCVLGPAARVAADVRRFAGVCTDVGRAEELRKLGTLVETAGDQRSVAILARTRIVDEGGDELTELDGLVLTVTAEGERWFVLEAKSGRGSGLAQIKRLSNVLAVEAKSPDRKVVPGCTAMSFSGVGNNARPR